MVNNLALLVFVLAGEGFCWKLWFPQLLQTLAKQRIFKISTSRLLDLAESGGFIWPFDAAKLNGDGYGCTFNKNSLGAQRTNGKFGTYVFFV